MSKRKAYLAIGLIVIVAVSGFIFYRYFVDWKNTGDVAVALKVVAKNQTSLTLSWEEHGILFESRNLKMSTVEADTSDGSVWMEIWNTKNGNLTSTTIDNLSPNTTYWFYMTVNGGSYLFVPYESNIIRATTYPSLLQVFIAFAILLGFAAVALILMRRLKWAWVTFVPALLIQVCEVTVSGANTYPSFFQILLILAFIMGATAVALILIRKPKWAVAILISLFLIQSYGFTVSSVSTSSSTKPTIVATQLWNFSIIGSVYYPPVVTDGYVYAISSFVQSSWGGVYCLNASNGAQVWNHTSLRGGGYHPPIVAGGIVYTSSEGVVYAFNASTGATIWNTTGRVWAMNDGVVYMYPGSFDGICALDALTGTRIWKYTTKDLGPIVIDGGYVYIYSNEIDSEGNLLAAQVYALYASNGAKKWNHNTEEYTRSLVVAGHYVYLGYNNRDRYANVVDSGVFALDAATGNQVWNYKAEGAVSAPVVAGGVVYVGSGSGNVYALNASSGSKIWNSTTDGSAGSPVLNGTYLYVSVNSKSEYGQASLYCLDASTGAKIWNYTTEPGNAASSPVVADDQIYVGNTGPQFFAHPDHYVYAFNASSGEQIWNYTIEGNAASLTVADGVVYVGASFATSGNRDNEGSGAVYALKPTVVRASLLPLTVIVVVMDGVILAVAFLVYRVRLKGAKGSPPATSSTQT